jgi:hypothetical protein
MLGKMERITHNKLLNYYQLSQAKDLEASFQCHQPTLLQHLNVSSLPPSEPITSNPPLRDQISDVGSAGPPAAPSHIMSFPESSLLICMQSESPKNPRQRHKLEPIASAPPVQDLLTPGTNEIMPSEEECKTLGIIPGNNPMYPETWSQQYEDKGQMLPPSLEPAPTTSPAALPSYNGHIYACLEDYVSQGPSNSLAMQIHDRYKPTGATGYYIWDHDNSCVDVIPAYPVGLEQNVWSLLENQR